MKMTNGPIRHKQANPSQGLDTALRLHQEGKLEEAALHYAAILTAQPNQFDAMHLLGVARFQQGRLAEGPEKIQSALKLQPTNAEALSNLGLVLVKLGRPKEALASYDQALAIRPDYAEALNNRGMALLDLKRPEEALASFDKALAIRPDYAEAHFVRGLLLLLTGEYTEGWREYEWRWRGGAKEEMKPRGFAKPQWNGEALSGQTVL